MSEDSAQFRPDVWLIRHGQSHANRSGELVGRRDIGLTDFGRLQADYAARHLRPRISGKPVVVASPLERAVDTARPIAAAFSVDVRVDDRLIELDYGELEGKLFVDLLADWPPSWVADPDVATPGGESYAQLEERVSAAIADAERAAVETGSTDVIIVTHLGPIKAAIKEAIRESGDAEEVAHLYESLLVSHASASVLAARGGARIVRSLNMELAPDHE